MGVVFRGRKERQTPSIFITQPFIPLAFVAAVGGVGFEDIAVSAFQLFQDGGFVDDSGPAVVGECAEKN